MDSSFLADVVDIRRWLNEDTDTPLAERLERERAISRAISQKLSSIDADDRKTGVADVDQVLAWWRIVSADDVSRTGERVVALARFATVLLTLFGAVIGMSAASFAFSYDGAYPVNLLALLGLLVGVPLVMLLATLILLPGRVPGLSAARDAVSSINPGRWVGAWLDRYAGMPIYAGLTVTRTAFARWQLLVFSQWTAVGYFGGVLLVGWLLVAATDLAFGWSSTLDLDAQTIHTWFSMIAAPWQSWLPVAAPDFALVEASRFFRIDSAAVSPERAAELGRWWPFVLMTILCYGLAPRVALLLFGGWRLAAAVKEMFLRDPEVVALIDRLSSPSLGFEPAFEESIDPDIGSVPGPVDKVVDQNTGVIVWNEALDDEMAQRWLAATLGAVGSRALMMSIRQDGSTLTGQLDGLPRELRRIVVFTKGWEPPLLEFSDFLERLRTELADDVTITIVPIDTHRTGVSGRDREIWATALARHDDPRLFVIQSDADTGRVEREAGDP